ncbi:sensor histidine kinase [Candidatus Anaplasma sp. TIGMIC]|uniref:sensor histidine kinase n=1 Tax=Candidatus Anaplasma sp. TIGMIC TaxID=3020713 RepID=UPI00232E8FA7|nr:ATP-binding protein [Candidatus Anaplasma sp. TIGMIC]MDB1135125.1 ATP-binding protein [Candidatus Anaplasma sp. TIGMIC]
MLLGFMKRRLLWSVLSGVLSSGVFSVLLASLDLLLVLLLFDVFGAWSVAPEESMPLLLGGLLLFLFFIAALSYWMMHIWIQCKRGELGFRLQARAVLVFTSVGMIPAVLVSGFAYLFFDYGVRAWYYNSIRPAFSQCVSAAFDQRAACISAVLSSDITHLSEYVGINSGNRSSKKLLLGSRIFHFSEVLLVENGQIVASSIPDTGFSMDSIAESELPVNKEKPVAIFTGHSVYAVQLIDESTKTYLVAVRLMRKAQEHDIPNNSEIQDRREDLRMQMSALQIQFSLAFLFLFLVLLFISVWLGASFAKGIVGRLSELFFATKRVQDGDFDCKIENNGDAMGEEIATVIRAFNQMVERLSEQRLQLENAYREINSRKGFVETVLSGVSSGVMALSPSKLVTLMNDRAMELLSCNELNKPLEEVFPEAQELVSGAKCKGDIAISRGCKSLILSVNIEWLKTQGLIITFDDISGLVEAQRKAAWSDVARRIAHEIKNPITPIYLAAERLSSKYSEQIVSERETFLRYTDTIIKHVSNISCIVDEFAQFARMPSPTFKMCDISAIIRDISFLGQFGKNVVYYDLSFPEEEVLVWLDQEQISQVFVNIFKNACESINASVNADNGRIGVVVSKREGSVQVEVRDNGVGFSEDLIGRLTEPYVTTRDQGTGLGLAIVQKILEEHGATISFCNSDEGGVVLMTFLK